MAEDATLVGKGTCPTAVAAFDTPIALEAPGVIVTVPFRLVGTIMTPKMPGKKELDTSGIRTCVHPKGTDFLSVTKLLQVSHGVLSKQ